jgi:hypothetical protein
MKIIIIGVIIGIVLGVSALVFFQPIHTETLQLCAKLHDDLTNTLGPTDEIRWKYDANNCADSIGEWKSFAKTNVIRTD